MTKLPIKEEVIHVFLLLLHKMQVSFVIILYLKSLSLVMNFSLIANQVKKACLGKCLLNQIKWCLSTLSFLSQILSQVDLIKNFPLEWCSQMSLSSLPYSGQSKAILISINCKKQYVFLW